MSIPLILVIVALVLAAVVQIQANGKNLLAWAVILLCVAGLWGTLVVA